MPKWDNWCYLCYRKQFFLPRTSYHRRLRNGSPCQVLLIPTCLNRNGCFALSGNWSSIYGTRNESGGADSGCSFIGTAPSETSWEVISAYGSWRLSKRLTHKLIGSMTKLQHIKSEPCQPHGPTTVRWRYRTFCQLHFGGRRKSSRIPIYEIWPVSLMGCQPWVQWWSHNKSWIQDIFSHLCNLRVLYAATATTFLMKITWLSAGIFIYGTE